MKRKQPDKNTLSEDIEEAIKATLAGLRRAQADIDRYGVIGKEEAEQQGNVARALAALIAEARKREKHVRDVVLDMTPQEKDELVLEYLRLLPRDRRAEFRSELDALDAAEVAA